MKPITHLTEAIDHLASGGLVRKRREQYGISLRRVAQRMGISAPYLSDLERGRRSWNESRFQAALVAIQDARRDAR